MVSRHVVYYWLTGVTVVLTALSYFYGQMIFTGLLGSAALLLGIYGWAHEHGNTAVIVGVLIGLTVCAIELVYLLLVNS